MVFWSEHHFCKILESEYMVSYRSFVKILNLKRFHHVYALRNYSKKTTFGVKQQFGHLFLYPIVYWIYSNIQSKTIVNIC